MSLSAYPYHQLIRKLFHHRQADLLGCATWATSYRAIFHVIINGAIFVEPLLHESPIYVVSIFPIFLTSVIGWVDVDALNSVFVARE